MQQPRILILELGANDGLRSLPLANTRDNLEQMITLARSRGITVLLLGMRMPPNYGERYTSGFRACTASWPPPTGWRWCRSCSTRWRSTRR